MICTDSFNEEKEIKRQEIKQHVSEFLRNKNKKIQQIPIGVTAQSYQTFSLFRCANCETSENRKHGTVFCKKCYAQAVGEGKKIEKMTRRKHAKTV